MTTQALSSRGAAPKAVTIRSSVHLAVADIGSTGARFELIEQRPEGFHRVLRDKVRLDLGPRVFAGGGIEEAAELRLSRLIERWQEICQQMGARARFVATSAFREAHNSQAVVDGIHRATGIQLELLSGEGEARLIARGALSSAGSQGTVVVIDVGGGSTEVAVGRDGRCLEAVSLPLGSARFGDARRALLTTGAVAVERLLQRSLTARYARGATRALITSGTTRALLRWAAPASSGCVGAAELPSHLRQLHSLTPAERAALFGDRAQKIVPAALILASVISRLKVPVLVPCKLGLRHGLLLELAEPEAS